ncbi:MAG: dephospho-CoA kinase [Sphingomonadales bacterium]|nr:dephospho-CoA kinase [Sphingomonadales bacterium]
MNKRVGLTGNMGSGKTLVAGIFTHLGIPVYNADERARALMSDPGPLRNAIVNLLGSEAYRDDGILNRTYIAKRVFQDTDLLQALNKLVHPAVAADSEQWDALQSAPYTLHEAALLVQSGSSMQMRCNILVTAPELLRMDRVRQRNGWSDSEILDRLKHQWSEERLRPHCQYSIINDGTHSLIEQVIGIHRLILLDLGK